MLRPSIVILSLLIDSLLRKVIDVSNSLSIIAAINTSELSLANDGNELIGIACSLDWIINDNNNTTIIIVLYNNIDSTSQIYDDDVYDDDDDDDGGGVYDESQ